MQLVTYRALTAAASAIMMMAQPTFTHAAAVAEFYRDKSIDLSIDLGPGGGLDCYARLLACHVGSFIPGNLAVVPRTLPGGGGVVAANHLYNAAPRDGRHIAIFGPFNAMEPLFGNTAAKFDPANFTWVGNMNLEVEGCGVWRTSGIQTLTDMQGKLA